MEGNGRNLFSVWYFSIFTKHDIAKMWDKYAFMDYMCGGQPDLSVERSFLIHPFILRKQENMSYPQVTFQHLIKSLEFMEVEKKCMQEVF